MPLQAHARKTPSPMGRRYELHRERERERVRSRAVKTLKQFIRDQREVYCRGILARTDGNVSESARLAGKERVEFYRLLKRLGIDPNDYRASKERTDR